MANLVTNYQDQIEELNSIGVFSVKEAIEILKELENLKGKLIKGSVLEKSIENYLGEMEVYDVAGVINALENLELKTEDEFNTSEVSVVKINELVDDYQKYLDKGLSDKEAINKIYKENKGRVSVKNIEQFVQKQREIYQKNLKELSDKKIVEEKEEIEIKTERISKEKFKFENEIKEEIVVDKEKIIEKKSNEIVEELIEKLKSDDRLKEVIVRNEENIKSELKDSVKKSILEESNLSEEIGNIFTEEKVGPINPEALPNIQTEIKIAEIKLNNWSNLNQESVNQFRGKKITNQIELEIIKENPNLSSEQLTQIQEYKKLIKELYFSENSLDQHRNEIFDSVSGELSPGQISNAWADVKGLTKLVKMNSKKFKKFSEKYEQVKKGLGDIKLPFKIKECRSFEGLMTTIKGSQLFIKAQGLVGWVNRIAIFRTEFMTRIGLKVGNVLVEKIGNQALQAFAKNSMKIIAEKGLQQGTGIILKGILKKGVEVGVKAGVEAGVAGGAAGASATVPVVGWIVAAAILVFEAIKFIGKKTGKALKNIGLSLGIKDFLQNNFGKFFGGIMNFELKLGAAIVAIPGIISVVSITSLTPIIIGVFVFMFGYQMFQSSLVSSLVPPQGEGNVEDIPIDQLPIRNPNMAVPEGCPDGWPTTGIISQGPNTTGSSHTGIEAIDIVGNSGKPIYATHDGIALPYSAIASNGKLGYYVRLEGTCNGKNFNTSYAHLPNNYLRGETVVKKGDLIGYIDNSGNSTGPHLHYQLNGLGSINNYLPKQVPNGFRNSKSNLIINVP